MKILSRAEWWATNDDPKPDVWFVPAMARRRLTLIERVALATAWKALDQVRDQGIDVSEIPVVFASRWGEIGTTLKLMKQHFEEGEMSPAGFANSVHNATPGHLSLLTKNHSSYTAIAAGAKSFDMGFLEATSMKGKVLFIGAEEDTPKMYAPFHPDVNRAHAIAMVIDNDLD